MTGYIPTHIIFISKPIETIDNEWEDGAGVINSFEAAPTYVATNEKTKESGMYWAQGYNTTKRGIKVTEAENKPFKSLRITSYEKRREGGGAFKAIADEKWYVDLRTDTLLDILVNHSVNNGEVQGAEFVWARVGSQAKVVRVGSSLHAQLVEATQLDQTKAPKASDLKPGDVYEAKNGDRAVFLGWVSTLQMKHEGSTSFSSPYIDPYTRGPSSEHEVEFKRVPKIQCWYEYSTSYEDKPAQKVLNEWLWFRVKLKKTNSFKKRLDSVQVPDDWKERIKKAIENRLDEQRVVAWHQGFSRPCDLAEYCESLHLAPVGQSAPIHPEYEVFKHLIPA